MKPTVSGPGLEIVAKLTDDDRTITSDLIWRIYSGGSSADGAPKMLSKHKNSRLEVPLDPGQYLVNVTYGRAHLTKRIKVNVTEPHKKEYTIYRADDTDSDSS